MKKQLEERRKKEEEVRKQTKKIAAQVQSVNDSQKRAAEAYKAEVNSLMKVNRDNLFVEDFIKLGEKLKEAMGMKKKIKEERNREVKNKVKNKKQMVNGKILKMVRIVVANMNLIDGRGKIELKKGVRETTKLLDILA